MTAAASWGASGKLPTSASARSSNVARGPEVRQYMHDMAVDFVLERSYHRHETDRHAATKHMFDGRARGVAATSIEPFAG